MHTCALLIISTNEWYAIHRRKVKQTTVVFRMAKFFVFRITVSYCWVKDGTKRGNSLDRRKSVVVRSLTWLSSFLLLWSSLFITLLNKVTTKLYNENVNNGGFGEFLIITDNYYRQLTFHISWISHEHDAHNFRLYRGSSACDDHDGHTSKQAYAASRF